MYTCAVVSFCKYLEYHTGKFLWLFCVTAVQMLSEVNEKQ